MNDRFCEQLSGSLSEIELLLPSVLCERTAPLTKEDISSLLRVYIDHVPALGSINAELHCWSSKWQQNINEAKLLTSPSKALRVVDSDFFPNVKELLIVSCTLSVTSAECERSVSRLRYLKTYLRSTMREDRLNGLAMMYIHRDTSCDSKEVVEQFARQHRRRLALVNPFGSQHELEH